MSDFARGPGYLAFVKDTLRYIRAPFLFGVADGGLNAVAVAVGSGTAS